MNDKSKATQRAVSGMMHALHRNATLTPGRSLNTSDIRIGGIGGKHAEKARSDVAIRPGDPCGLRARRARCPGREGCMLTNVRITLLLVTAACAQPW